MPFCRDCLGWKKVYITNSFIQESDHRSSQSAPLSAQVSLRPPPISLVYNIAELIGVDVLSLGNKFLIRGHDIVLRYK